MLFTQGHASLQLHYMPLNSKRSSHIGNNKYCNKQTVKRDTFSENYEYERLNKSLRIL